MIIALTKSNQLCFIPSLIIENLIAFQCKISEKYQGQIQDDGEILTFLTSLYN